MTIMAGMHTKEYQPAPLERVAAFMTGLALASNQMKLAEMALLELLGWCALVPKDTAKVVWS